MWTSVAYGMSVLASIVIAFGVTYIMLLSVLGIRQARRDGMPVSRQEALLDAEIDPSPDLRGISFFYLVPALNEERVIGGTIAALLAREPDSTVIVVDDGSDDRTASIVESFVPTGRVIRHSRVAPHARLGKGRALNDGVERIRDEVRRQDLDPSKVVVGVVDADGRMTPNASPAVARYFADDPSVGGIQLVVRIRNRHTLSLVFQDMQFWVVSGLMQMGRVGIGSVSMGGNGQFTRLSALDEIGPEPWSDSLTEDLDLGLSLATRGWRNVAAPGAYVTRQGLANLRAMLRQHTRWYQGHMMAAARLPELARSKYLPTTRFLELAGYLAVPWLLGLPWSILQQYILVMALRGQGFVHSEGKPAAVVAGAWGLWYLISFAPQIFWGVLYWRRARTVSFVRAFVMAHLMIPWSYMGFICNWRALGRILLRRNGWTKTTRAQEDDLPSDAPTTRQGAAATGGA